MVASEGGHGDVKVQVPKISLKKRWIATLYSRSARSSEALVGVVKPCWAPLYTSSSQFTFAARRSATSLFTSVRGATSSSAPCRISTRPLMFLARSEEHTSEL